MMLSKGPGFSEREQCQDVAVYILLALNSCVDAGTFLTTETQNHKWPGRRTVGRRRDSGNNLGVTVPVLPFYLDNSGHRTSTASMHPKKGS